MYSCYPKGCSMHGHCPPKSAYPTWSIWNLVCNFHQYPYWVWSFNPIWTCFLRNQTPLPHGHPLTNSPLLDGFACGSWRCTVQSPLPHLCTTLSTGADMGGRSTFLQMNVGRWSHLGDSYHGLFRMSKYPLPEMPCNSLCGRRPY